ncbi:MAG: SDR family oxidoreductase [Acidobacteria bacterium]|nr:SDR family oxidoreductase [Acidobacteriota bacterium]
MVAHIEGLGRKSLAVPTDVVSREQLSSLVDRVVERFGRVDILVNSAGAHIKVPTLDMKEEEWDRIMNINLKGLFFACQRFGRQMVKQKKGKIINIASIGSFVSLHEVSAYCVSKAGVAELTKCLACEWAPYNVNVNAIAPGVFRTPLNAKVLDIPERLEKLISHTPMKRLGKLEELVGAAIFLATEASDYVTGETILVDGGFIACGI